MSVLVIEARSPETKFKFAEIVMKHRLFIQGYGKDCHSICGYCAKGERDSIGETTKRMTLAFLDGIPVGVAVVGWTPWGWCTHVFVRKSVRRLGIGKMLIKELKPKGEERRFFATGSVDFFHAQKGFRKL